MSWYSESQKQDYNERIKSCSENLQRDGIYTSTHKINHSEIVVLRDDKLCGGTKSRIGLEYLPRAFEEYVYITPWHGGAQIALSLHVRELQSAGRSKKAIFFTREFQEETPAYIRVAQNFGGVYHYVPPHQNPYDVAKKYVQQDPKRRILIPSGFKTLENIERIGNIAKKVKEKEGMFDEVWCAVGSGCLILGLQKGNISKKYFGVCVFNACPDMGNAIPIIPDMEFNTPVNKEDKPPYSSSSHYDAKVWKYVRDRAKLKSGRYLIWNVM